MKENIKHYNENGLAHGYFEIYLRSIIGTRIGYRSNYDKGRRIGYNELHAPTVVEYFIS